MSKVLYYPIMYLDNNDFNNNNKLVLPDNLQNKKNVVVMMQTSWCPHCTNAKPDFQTFAEKYQDQIICATIQADGDTEEEKKLGERIEKIVPGFQGYPEYCLFVRGERQDKKINGRNVKGLVEFANL